MFKKYSSLLFVCLVSFHSASYPRVHDEEYMPLAESIHGEGRNKTRTDAEFINRILHKISCKCIPFLCQSDRVEVPYPQVAPLPHQEIAPGKADVHGIDECNKK